MNRSTVAIATGPASDSELVDQLSTGEANALGALYDRYGARAFRVAQSICHDSGHAEDAVQNAFASLFKGLHGYQPERSTVAAWLMTIVYDRAIDTTPRSIPHDIHVRTALAELPDTQRQIITLAFYGELSQSEIASQLNLPAEAVKSHMRLGMLNLHHDLSHQS